MPIEAISGEPGSRWTNNTDKILWQFVCQFANSCGRCIQFAGQIGPWWPLPIHRRCNCRNHPVMPGSEAKPFVDFRAEVEALDPAQQAVVMGRSNYALVQSGAVKWEDVVHRKRILNFREVVAKGKFGVEDLVKGGVARGTAQRAWVTVHSPEITAAAAQRIEFVKILEEKGFRYDAIRNAVSRKLMARVGIGAGPSLASGPASRIGGRNTGLAVVALTAGFKPPAQSDRKPLTEEEQDELDRKIDEFIKADLWPGEF